MIVPDVNLLLYAYDSTSPHHPLARDWWQAALSGNEGVGLTSISIFGFVRVGTNRRVFRNPMTAAEAVGHVRSWLNQPLVRILTPGPDHVLRVCDLLVSLSTAGNLVTDAQLAATAMEHNAVLHTADGDFSRFAGLQWFNPLTRAASRSSSRSRGRSP